MKFLYPTILISITLLLSITIPALSAPLDPVSDLTAQLDQLVASRSLRGLQLQITKNGEQVYYHNKGTKNDQNQPIDPNTMFRIASCSKSFTSVAIMQLVQQNKLKLNDTLTSIFGFQVKNPHFPQTPITVEMILSHTSSIMQPGTQYDNFLTDTYNSKDGSTVPSIRQILLPGGKYYNPSIYPATHKPGEFFHYSNLGFVLAGTVVEIVSQKRFDVYMQGVVEQFSDGLKENATYNVARIKDYKNLGTIYVGSGGKWVPRIDNYTGTIPERNLTFYRIGTNGGVFGPQGGLRASVRHLNNYMYMYINKGVLKNGKRLLSQQSVNEILKPRYQYHGSSGGAKVDFHLYGLGIFTTSYLKSDFIIDHEVVRGHTGSAYGLISGYHFWKDYSFSYIINGALNGYGYDSSTIYEKETVTIHQSVDGFLQKMQGLGQNLGLRVD